ncbi:hypothetical protein [Peribacillus asahii]|uniref:hypothetical protein n=1 Tax=Peribacillus asahii TaxID=228899 RepID=UPI00207ADF71|nr:hypothetical protein [Peribacillus asahii]USK69193.1 hypothetical protein LIS76_16715 [Peribacillus asahii]
MRLSFEEVIVIRLVDGSIKELYSSNKESIKNYKGAILLKRYFLAKNTETESINNAS